MGKISDAVMALIILIIGLYVLSKLGLTAGAIWTLFKSFFSGSSPSSSNNTTAGVIFGMGMTNSKAREKLKNHIIDLKRRIALRNYKREEQEAKRRLL